MRWLQNIERFEGWITKILEMIITVFFFIILLLTIILVLLRYIFNTSIIGGSEAMEYLFIYTTAIGAAVSLKKREHIKITYFIDKLPEPFRKIIDIIGLLLIGCIHGVMLWYSVSWIRSVGNHKSPVLRIPNWTIQVIIPVTCGLIILYCLYLIFMTILKKSGRT
ncbi:MAG: TRAP transporter small permease [Spirochaetales bacterium]|nr:TRAP transporter small permease [Spirochaetales bacterium]